MRDPQALIGRGADIIKNVPFRAFSTTFARHATWIQDYDRRWFRSQPYSIVVECWLPSRESPPARELLSIIYMERVERPEFGLPQLAAIEKEFHPLERRVQRFSVSLSRRAEEAVFRLTFWDREGNALKPTGAGSPITKREQSRMLSLLDKARTIII